VKEPKHFTSVVPFDPIKTQEVPGFYAWPHEGVQPRDGSWGFVVVHGDRIHLHSGDTIYLDGDTVVDVFKNWAR
jgi:predicted membrane-bound spermidine synthase